MSFEDYINGIFDNIKDNSFIELDSSNREYESGKIQRSIYNNLRSPVVKNGKQHMRNIFPNMNSQKFRPLRVVYMRFQG